MVHLHRAWSSAGRFRSTPAVAVHWDHRAWPHFVPKSCWAQAAGMLLPGLNWKRNRGRWMGWWDLKDRKGGKWGRTGSAYQRVWKWGTENNWAMSLAGRREIQIWLAGWGSWNFSEWRTGTFRGGKTEQLNVEWMWRRRCKSLFTKPVAEVAPPSGCS